MAGAGTTVASRGMESSMGQCGSVHTRGREAQGWWLGNGAPGARAPPPRHSRKGEGGSSARLGLEEQAGTEAERVEKNGAEKKKARRLEQVRPSTWSGRRIKKGLDSAVMMLCFTARTEKLDLSKAGEQRSWTAWCSRGGKDKQRQTWIRPQQQRQARQAKK